MARKWSRRGRSQDQILSDIQSQEKVCPQCEELKPFSEFPTEDRRPDGRGCHCKSCKRAYYDAYKASGERRDKYLKWKYGITPSEYDEILRSQNGVCSICGSDEKGRLLAVDHCHETGEVRGILCSRCNTGLGCFRDDDALLAKAREYLEKRNGVAEGCEEGGS